MVLMQSQRDVLTGLLLEDGSLEFDKFKASRLQVKQSVNKKEYVFWLYRHFADLVKTAPQQRKDALQWYWSTRSFSEIET